MPKPFIDSEICQTCGKCCQTIWFFTRSRDDYLRYSWLPDSTVTVDEIAPSTWRIWIKLTCTKLKKENGLWVCSVHDQERPSYCATYPLSFVQDKKLPPGFLEKEAEFCPALKELLKSNE